MFLNTLPAYPQFINDDIVEISTRAAPVIQSTLEICMTHEVTILMQFYIATGFCVLFSLIICGLIVAIIFLLKNKRERAGYRRPIYNHDESFLDDTNSVSNQNYRMKKR